MLWERGSGNKQDRSTEMLRAAYAEGSGLTRTLALILPSVSLASNPPSQPPSLSSTSPLFSHLTFRSGLCLFFRLPVQNVTLDLPKSVCPPFVLPHPCLVYT